MATGYTFVAANGGTYGFGSAPAAGNIEGKSNAPVVGIASTSDGKGYWEAASDGGVFSYGDAPFVGSLGAIKLAKPIDGIVPAARQGLLPLRL